jgi:hypothetical protein
MTGQHVERFWSKVDRSNETGCWPWLAGKTPAGYGYVWWGGKMTPAHRVAWKLTRGRIPDGLSIDHLCRNRACCQPTHLEPVQHRTNVFRGEAPTAVNARKTHCPKGHELAGDNLIASKLPRRECRICWNESVKLKARLRRTGATAQPVMSLPDDQRFWVKVDRSGGPDACWPWLAGKARTGYGRVAWKGGPRTAHRVAWELTNGPLPEAAVFKQRCGDRGCVNPAHWQVLR